MSKRLLCLPHPQCEDINECLLRNGHGPCEDTCYNTFGSFSCTCENLPGTRLMDNGRSCEDAGDCAFDNGGCSHTCLTNIGRMFCLCPEGFLLGPDWKTCQGKQKCPGIRRLTVHLLCDCPSICLMVDYRINVMLNVNSTRVFTVTVVVLFTQTNTSQKHSNCRKLFNKRMTCPNKKSIKHLHTHTHLPITCQPTGNTFNFRGLSLSTFTNQSSYPLFFWP